MHVHVHPLNKFLLKQVFSRITLFFYAKVPSPALEFRGLALLLDTRKSITAACQFPEGFAGL